MIIVFQKNKPPIYFLFNVMIWLLFYQILEKRPKLNYLVLLFVNYFDRERQRSPCWTMSIWDIGFIRYSVLSWHWTLNCIHILACSYILWMVLESKGLPCDGDLEVFFAVLISGGCDYLCSLHAWLSTCHGLCFCGILTGGKQHFWTSIAVSFSYWVLFLF